MAGRSDAPTLVGLRIGTAEREACVTSLQEHFAAGRLSIDELDARIHQALRATTAADLQVLVNDLPRDVQKGRPRHRRSRRIWWIMAAASLGVGSVIGLGSLVERAPTPAGADEALYCESTGQTTLGFCPDTSPAQQRILRDAIQADELAQQLDELANGNPDRSQFRRLADRAEALRQRVQDSSIKAQELVTASEGEVSTKALSDLAATAHTSAVEIQKLLDQALDL